MERRNRIGRVFPRPLPPCTHRRSWGVLWEDFRTQ